jgi:hypothetical protein
LARSRKEIEDQRKEEEEQSKPAAVSSNGKERDATVDDAAADGAATADDDDDDNTSVKSSLSGRFRRMLKKSNSTDTADKKNSKKKKASNKDLGLSDAKSMDAEGDETAVDDVTIAKSLGPGLAFLKPSKGQVERTESQSSTSVNSKKDGVEMTEEEQLVAAKKAVVSKEYQTPEKAPSDTNLHMSIPLPPSFSTDNDEASVFTSYSIKTEAPGSTIPEDSEVKEASPSSSSDDDQIHVNEGLRVLLENAVSNSGRGGMDVTEFIKVLEDEWVTDVEALRRLDRETLDDLLPLMLSRELQRMIGHADSIDNNFLKEDRKALNRGRSPKMFSKRKKNKLNRRLKKKGNQNKSAMPQVEPALASITEGSTEEASVASVNSEEATTLSTITGAMSGSSSPDKYDPSYSKVEAMSVQEEEEECEEDSVDDYDTIGQSTSAEDLEIRKVHATLIAEARKKFPTRESLEDAIRERQGQVETAVNSGFTVDKQTLARAALADDEIRKLLPLRLILPTVSDLNEMIDVLQLHKEDAFRSLDMEKARNIQGEIAELQEQIEQEEKYILKKKLGSTKCESCGSMFPTEKKQSGILKTKETHCEKCRDSVSTVRADGVTVDSRDDKDSS